MISQKQFGKYLKNIEFVVHLKILQNEAIDYMDLIILFFFSIHIHNG